MAHHPPGIMAAQTPSSSSPWLRIGARMLTAALVFGITGPLVGYVLVFVAGIVISPKDFGVMLLALVVSVLWVLPVLFAYIAFWPALLTGLIAGVLSLMRTRAVIYYFAIAASGAAIGYAWFRIFPQDAIIQDPPWFYAVLGAVSGAACAWILRMMTPKAERR